MGRAYDATWGRFFSAIYDRLLKRTEDGGLRELRRKLLSHASGPTIDIGAGTGANIGLFPDGLERIVLAEPDPHMAKRLRRKLAESGSSAELVEAPAEKLPFEDASFETAVFTLVLCTVPIRRWRWPRRHEFYVRVGSSSSSSTYAPRTVAWPAGKIASKVHGRCSPTDAAATETPWPRSKPCRLLWMRSSTVSCRTLRPW